MCVVLSVGMKCLFGYFVVDSVGFGLALVVLLCDVPRMTLDCCLTPTPSSNDDGDDGDDMRMVVLCDFDLSKTKAGSMDWVGVYLCA